MGTMFVIIVLVVYVGMLVHAYVCEGDIECLSDIAYDKHEWLFPVIMWVMACCLFMGGLEKTPETWQFLCYLAAAGCYGIGLTPYKEEGNIILHKLYSMLAMISVCGLWIVHGEWWMPFLYCLAGLRKKWLLGIEMGIMASAIAYCLI